ncbi:WXG100 family type VII secretion target [Nocardioides ungokensis]|uniref:WXG100 family type VII secretion target n=1 Tax=Nocardioides ungokensis TaxID=1643322 RepID=UPI0015DE08EA|nr:WXG100 family type VII secretion target [Nocardioides ungokensis]
MSNSAPEMGQGERTLSRAAGMVAEAKQDFDGFSRRLDGQIAGLRGAWCGAGGTAFFALHQAWTERQRVITGALDEFEASLRSTERDNTHTDQTQAAGYQRTAGRLG